jgi:putative flippase GtrA
MSIKQLLQKLYLFLAYNASAFSTFLLELVVLYLCNGILNIPYYAAVPVAFIGATLVHYVICRLWVFDHSGRALVFESSYFFSILGSGLVWTLLLVAVFIQFWAVPVIVARILAGIFTSVWSFYLNARFNFRARAFIPHK